MTYQALYRVYRPQTFADVVGQDHIVRTLENMLQQERIYHAFLFCGPRGTGKTTLAKILAKALNCMSTDRPTPKPCLACASCIGIKQGSNLDVLEIDGASNRGIDEIRDLREGVKFAPNQGRYKVYIIDEVHMLTVEAFNALLKTLEEPPEHVIFIFATTEVQKLPATILSRVQRFDFRRLSQSVIAERLRQVAASADIAIEEAALQVMAQAANGGLRDALAILDQTHSYAGDEPISVPHVQEVVGLVPYAEYARLWSSLVGGDAKQALVYLRGVLDGGRETAQVVSGFIRFCRDLLLYKSAPELVAEETRAYFNNLPGGSSQALVLIDELLCAERDLRSASDPSILVELAFLRFLQRQQPKGNLTTSSPVVDVVPDLPDLDVPEPAPKETGVNVVEPASAQPAEEFPPPPAPPTSKEDKVSETAKPLTIRQVGQKWPDFLANIMSDAPALGAKLAGARIALCQGCKIVLQFEKEFSRKFVADNLETVCQELSQLLKQPVKVECVLLNEENPTSGSGEDALPPSETDALRVALSLFEGESVDPTR